MNIKILSICIRIFLSVLFLSFIACSDDEKELGVMDFIEASKTVNYKQGRSTIEVLSNMKWKIGALEQDWFKLNTLEGIANQTIEIEYEENQGVKPRSVDILFVTIDGKGYKKFTLNQISSAPSIVLDEPKLEVGSRPRTHTIGITTNIPVEELSINVDYENVPESNWIVGEKLADNQLSFNVALNQENNDRKATIIISYADNSTEGEEIWTSLEVIQYAKGNDGPPEEKDFDYVKALPQGMIDENISVKGNIVSNGKSDNLAANTYIIQDNNNKAIVFESEESLTFNRYDKVHLLLDGATMSNNTEIGYTYNVVKGISSAHILEQSADAAFKPIEIYMQDLTEDYMMSMVTLKDVEFSIPFGGYTNFNEGYQTISPIHLRNYPASIRDINGDYMYMLTNNGVSYRKQTVPQGSGKITGIIVREPDSYYGDIGRYSIRQLDLSDIAIAKERNNGFSNILVEWDCAKPAGMTDGQQSIPPVIGNPAAVLTKSNATGFYSSGGTGRVYFTEEYRGDATAGKIATAAFNVGNWDTECYWIMKGISTSGINKTLSLQIETNSSPKDGALYFAVEYALSEDGPWNLVEEYTCKGQIATTVKDNTVIPGFKIYNFNLPAELQDKPNIFLRLRCTSMMRQDGQIAGNGLGLGTNRLAHVSIKYNK